MITYAYNNQFYAIVILFLLTSLLSLLFSKHELYIHSVFVNIHQFGSMSINPTNSFHKTISTVLREVLYWQWFTTVSQVRDIFTERNSSERQIGSYGTSVYCLYCLCVPLYSYFFTHTISSLPSLYLIL